ncbi:MAG: hypothetical protein ACERKD_11585 [Prolixibacteraceae bacterium]
MERSKYYVVIALLLFLMVQVQASNKEAIYQSYLTNNMQGWKHTIDEMQKNKTNDAQYLLELINYQYGYIAWCIGNEKMKEARWYLDKAFDNLEAAEAFKNQESMVYAYKAAFWGFEIGLAKYKAPYYGLKSIEASKKALALDSENWLAYVQSANIQYYMPPIFGGSKKEALHQYKKAMEIMEKQKKEIIQDWNYLNLLVIIAQGYTQESKIKEAIALYEIILKIEPQFSWVKNQLYPDALKLKISNNE